MANRIVKDLIWGSESLSKVSLLANGFFLRLLPFPDDHGCFDARTAILRARLFPLMLDRVSENDIAAWLHELQSIDCVRLWLSEDGIKYGLIPSWSKHQQIRSVHRRKTPEPPESVVSGKTNLIAIDIKCNQSLPVDALNPNPNLNPLVKRNIVEFPENPETSTMPTSGQNDHILESGKMVDTEPSQHTEPKTPEIPNQSPAVEILDNNPTHTPTHDKKINKANLNASQDLEFAQAVIDDLNEVVGTRYKSSNKSTLAAITARRNQGFTLEDFRKVHRKKAKQWINDPKMCAYLRPDTLYQPSKFESYLNEKEPQPGARDPSRPMTRQEKTRTALAEWAKMNEGRMHEEIGTGN